MYNFEGFTNNDLHHFLTLKDFRVNHISLIENYEFSKLLINIIHVFLNSRNMKPRPGCQKKENKKYVLVIHILRYE